MSIFKKILGAMCDCDSGGTSKKCKSTRLMQSQQDLKIYLSRYTAVCVIPSNRSKKYLPSISGLLGVPEIVTLFV